MPATIILIHHYDAPPAEVWRVATDFACFAEAMEGVATFEGMTTEGQLQEGMTETVKVRLLGKLPPMDYTMNIAECDHEAHRFRSVEHGGSIKRWEHVLTVTPDGNGSKLTDLVTIDAGVSTPLMKLWARYVYRKRHKPRLRMLGLI